MEAVIGHLLAVQAQDGRGFRLSVRSRSSGLLASDVDHALSADRSLVVSWLNRGTLHLVTADDYWWLHPLTTPQLATVNERRLRQEGVSAVQAARGVDLVVDAVTSDGPQSREQLRVRLAAARIPTAGQALVHILFAATMRGSVVRGPMIDNEHAYVSVPRWLGSGAAPSRPSRGAPQLARRYLVGHAPATARDLAKWAGVTLGDARTGFDGVADEVAERQDVAAALPPPRLLGAFDPLLHGWQSRAPFVGPHAGVVTTNGMFRPVRARGRSCRRHVGHPGRCRLDHATRTHPRERSHRSRRRRRRRVALSRAPGAPGGRQLTRRTTACCASATSSGETPAIAAPSRRSS